MVKKQDYPRESGGRALPALFPKLDPPLNLDLVRDAIKEAFDRANKDRMGQRTKPIDSSEKLVETCLKHLRERNDPILWASFFSELNASEIFPMDGIPHEMQRYRMIMGVFYQYLLVELMRKASIPSSDSGEDIMADVKTPGDERGLRLYISVKKSDDTLGGRDIEGAVTQLEAAAEADKNRTSPYMCVIAIATPNKGKVYKEYDRGRKIRTRKHGRLFSPNFEVWQAGFLYPYITGHSPVVIYKEGAKLVKNYFPFYSVRFKNRCADELKKELIKLRIATNEGSLIKEALAQYVTQEV